MARPRLTVRGAVSVAVDIVGSAADVLVSWLADRVDSVPTVTFDSLAHAQWVEMVEAASVSRPSPAQRGSNGHQGRAA